MDFAVFPWALLRTPGLPAATLDPLADEVALAAADELLGDQTLPVLTEEFESTHLPRAFSTSLISRADRARIGRARRTVARGEPLTAAQFETWCRYGDASWARRWQQACAEHADRAERAEQTYQRAVRSGRDYLARRCSQPDVAHAIFLSSRDFYDNAYVRYVRPEASARDDTKTRQAFATVARYLRRMSVRCELTSFFGPVHFVGLDQRLPSPMRSTDPVPEQIFVEPSVWLIDELHRRIQRAVPLARRRPRRNPTVTLVDGALTRVTDGTVFDVSPQALALWLAVDGARTVPEACLAAEVDPAGAGGLLRQLAGAVILTDDLPAHSLTAFEQVVSHDEAEGPARVVARMLREFAEQDWPDRARTFTAVEEFVAGLGIEQRRGKGRHYADRYVLHEERAHPGSTRTTLGAPVVAGLTNALSDLLPLSFLAALVDRADAREAVRAVVGGRPTRLIDLLRAEIPPVRRRGDAFRAALRALVDGRTRGTTAVLEPADLQKLVTEFCPPLSAQDCYATLAGPDMMALDDPATGGWLLSELHDDGSYLGGGVTRLHPEGARVRRELLDGVAQVLDPAVMAPVVSRRRNMFLVPEMPGIAIELSGLSEKSRDQTVPISEVFVAPEGDAVLVGGRRLRLYTGDIPSVAHRALAVPSLVPVTVDCGGFTPRVRIGTTVVQRARWRMTTGGWEQGYPGWLAVQAERGRRGLPRRVFVRHPAEQKPLYVDFADPYSVEDLVRLPRAEVTVAEMLPAVDSLWWPDRPDKQCAELRTACLVVLRTLPVPGRGLREERPG